MTRSAHGDLLAPARLRSLTGALVIGVATLLPALAGAQTSDVKIDTVTVGKAPKEVEFRGIEILGTNLTRDEVLKLLNDDTAKADALAIAARMKATSASISEIVPKAPDSGNLVIRGLRAEGVSEGRITRMSLAGFDGVPVFDGIPATLRGGALTIDDIDLTSAIKAAQDNSLTGFAPKAARMSWNGFDLSFPDKDTPATAAGGNTIKIHLGALDGQSTYQDNLPLKSSGAIRNLTIEFPKQSQAGLILGMLGYERLDLSMNLGAGYDPAKKSFMLDDFTVNGANVGAIGLRAEFANIEPAALRGSQEDRVKALMAGDIAGVDLRVVNAGGFEKGLALLAQQQGKTADALRAEWTAMVTQLVPAVLGGDPSATSIATAVSSFIKDPKSLTVSVKGKSGPVKIAALAATADPTAVLQLVSLSAVSESAGTAAPAPAATPQAAAAPPAAAAPQVAQVAPKAAEAGKLTGVDAWKQIVGNSISGKDEDGAPLVEYYRADGSLRQLDDDEAQGGTWTLKGQQVCLDYDDSDDAVCFKIEVSGNTATFIEEDGTSHAYTILKGNPRKL